jgi:uncharacterized membrane protein
MNETKSKDRGLHFLGRPLGLVLLALYKSMWGATEMVAGVLLFFSHKIFARELIEDPQDLFVNWLFAHFGVKQAEQMGGIILLLGAIKIALGWGLWYRSWAVRKIAIIFFIGAGFYALYEASIHLTVFRLAALCVDIFLIYYCWKVLPKHLRHNKVV